MKWTTFWTLVSLVLAVSLCGAAVLHDAEIIDLTGKTKVSYLSPIPSGAHTLWIKDSSKSMWGSTTFDSHQECTSAVMGMVQSYRRAGFPSNRQQGLSGFKQFYVFEWTPGDRPVGILKARREFTGGTSNEFDIEYQCLPYPEEPY